MTEGTYVAFWQLDEGDHFYLEEYRRCEFVKRDHGEVGKHETKYNATDLVIGAKHSMDPFQIVVRLKCVKRPI